MTSEPSTSTSGTAAVPQPRTPEAEENMDEADPKRSWTDYVLAGVWTVGIDVPWYIVKTGVGVSQRVASRALNPPETPEQSMEKEGAFHRKLHSMEGEDFSDLEALRLVQLSGKDKKGRPIMWITGRHLPAVGVDLDRVKWFIYKNVLEVAASGEFDIVYLNSCASWEENSPGIRWIRRSYEEVPIKYKENLKRFFVVHPGGYMRSLLWVMGPLSTGGFWDKLEFVDRVEFLWDEIDRSQCIFHDFVLEHDAELETSPLMDYGIYADPSQAQGELGAYMAAGHAQTMTTNIYRESRRL